MSGLLAPVTDLGGRVRGRVRRVVRRRVATVRKRDRRRRRRSEFREYAFGGGYLVRADGRRRPQEVTGWPSLVVGGDTYHARIPLTSRSVATGETLVVIGHPVDVDHSTTDPQVIVDRLAAVAEDAGGGQVGTAAVLRGAAYLGGRWTLFLHGTDGGLTVLTDALATQPLWHTTDGRLLASHGALVPGGRVLPTNSVLRTTRDGQISVQRYWPWPPDDISDPDVPGVPGGRMAPVDPQAAYQEFRERLLTHTRLLCEMGRPGVALTAGRHSRAVLAAYLPHRRADGFAFTHYATTSVRQDRKLADDLFAASALAHRVDLPHRVLPTLHPRGHDDFADDYRATYPDGETLGRAFAHHLLPQDTVELHSAGAEVVDQHSWEHLDGTFREGDLAHRVMLPFNDRRVLELMLGTPDRQGGSVLVARLAAEVTDAGAD